MTSKERREKAAEKYANSIAQHDERKTYCVEDFIAGAKWADKTMIDKACEWLRRTQPQAILPDTTIERFRKAMDE